MAMEEKTIEMKPIVGKKKVTVDKKTTTHAENTEPVNSEPTADQFRQALNDLYTKNQQLIEALNEKNTAMMFRRIDYLFKVLEQSHMFDDEFVTKCIDELQNTLDITQEKVNAEDGEQD